MSSFPSGHISLRILCELQNNEKKACSVIEVLSLLILSNYVDKTETKQGWKRVKSQSHRLPTRARGHQHEPQVNNMSHRSLSPPPCVSLQGKLPVVKESLKILIQVILVFVQKTSYRISARQKKKYVKNLNINKASTCFDQLSETLV